MSKETNTEEQYQKDINRRGGMEVMIYLEMKTLEAAEKGNAKAQVEVL